MAAKTNYFSHDAGARNDSKIVRLRMRHGAAGYGVYFMLLERLREENDYRSATDYEMIAYELHVDIDLVRSVVEDFDLFMLDAEAHQFYSPSFCARMSLKDEVSRKRSESGKRGVQKRWNNAEASDTTSVTTDNPENPTENGTTIANATQCDSKPIANAKQIDSKESKVKERKKVKNVVVDVTRESSVASSVTRSAARVEATPPTAVIVTSPPTVDATTEAMALQRDLRALMDDSNRLWRETVSMQFAIHDEAEWREAIAEFYSNCIAQDEINHENISRLKAHFTNWLRIYRAAQKREQDANDRRIPTKSEANRRAVENLAHQWSVASHGVAAPRCADRPC